MVVTKNTTGGNGTFGFTLTGPGGVTMSATISTTGTTLTGSGTATFSGLAPGTYTVTEAANADFVPVGLTTCTAVVTGAGSTPCSPSFLNNARGSVVVTKNTAGGNGTFTFTLTGPGVTMSATISTTGSTVAGSGTATFSGLAQGTYTVTEAANPDFVAAVTTCTAVVTGAGSTPCLPAFANAAKGSVVVTKNTTGGNGVFTFTLTGTGVSATATITTTGTTVAGSGTATFAGLPQGTYTVTEGTNPDFVPVGATTCIAVVTGAGATPCLPAFTNAAKGVIVVTKQVEGGSGSFTFSLTPGGSSITLSGGASGTTVTLTGSFTSLSPGTYTVTEVANSGFTAFGSTSCTAIVGAGQINTGCAFTDQANGQIVVTKQVQGGNGSFVFSLTPGGSSITLSGGAPGTTVNLTGSFTGLAPNTTYTVSESASAGFTAVGPTVCTTSFGPGGSATCAFTDQASGQIVVTKQVEGGSGSFTFSLTGNGTSGSLTLSGGSMGTTVTLTGSFTGLSPNTTYTVSESANAGFVPVGPTTCVTSFAPGGSATCAFTDQAKGQIVVTKQIQGGNGSFTFTLTGGGQSGSLTLSGGAPLVTVTLTGSFTGLPANNTYTVSETVPAGFTPVGPTVCVTSFGPGGSPTCSFTNQAIGSVVVTKNTTGGNGTFSFTLTGPGGVTMSATISTTGSTVAGSGTATFNGLAPGTYTVTEAANSDFVPVGLTTCTAVVAGPGSMAPCLPEFSNAHKGQIVVTKQVEGGNGSFTFSLTPGGSSIILSGGAAGTTVTLTGSFTGLAPNTSFTVSETVPGSFVPVGPTTCVTGFAPGGSATCAFTDQAKGQIVVTKNTSGGNADFTFTLSGAVSATATITTTGTSMSGSGSVTFAGLPPGTFTVSEGPNPDFVPFGLTSCNATVTPGATFTCSFTNFKKAAGFMTGGGQIHNNFSMVANFGGNARGTSGEPATAKGHFNYNRIGLHLNGKVDNVLLVDQFNHTMWFCFTDSKTNNAYTVKWHDQDEPNQGQDTLSLWSGCNPAVLMPPPGSEAGIGPFDRPVEKGNVQWHPPQ